jgi:hypothetical protein
MTRRHLVLCLIAGSLAAGLAACGKKSAPKRSDGSTGMKIDPKTLKKPIAN